MRILLIGPGTSGDLDNQIIRDVTYLRARALFGPTALVTVASLTPPGHEVVVHDEHMRGPVDERIEREQFDIVGVNLTTNQFGRALAIAEMVKRVSAKTITVAGGIGAPLLLHEGAHRFDVVFHGEAEQTWPRFIEEASEGRHAAVYQRYTRPDLSVSPTPRWELIAEDIPHYGTLSVQTTRGCPHDCAFCDVIYTYGRRPRSKSVAQVLDEIRLLERLGARMIFIADDNFGGGNREYERELARELAALNNTFDQPLMFMTQVDILVAKDRELLELMADANFIDLMIGIESVNQDALRDMNKTQNLRVDLVEAVREIQSYGIAVLGHMIIGADSDDAKSFAVTEEFVNKAGILHHFCHPLMAPPGTRLWYQYAREGRLVKQTGLTADRLDIVPNIVPRRLSRVELMDGLADYWDRVFDPRSYLARAISFVNGVKRQPRVRRPSPKVLGKVLGLMANVVWFYATRVSREHRKAFFTLMRIAGPRGAWLMPKVIFLYTCFLMDHARAKHDAAIARDQARRERENPGIVEIQDSRIPVSSAVRELSEQILDEAYRHVRVVTGSRELLYRIVVDAFVDFSDRYGQVVSAFGDVERANLLATCDRAIVSVGSLAGAAHDLPTDRPPPGFVRDILDAADSAIRVRMVKAS